VDIEVTVTDAFSNLVEDWEYPQYLVIGGYGSGKSYHVALKLILLLLAEKRRVLVVREVFDTIYESAYNLFREIVSEMGLLDGTQDKCLPKGIIFRKAPMTIRFPNGSEILFKGLDRPEKIKSINDISIVWIEEATEIKYAAYKELLGRVRAHDKSLHFILSCNPIGKENWVYQHFFKRIDDTGKETTIVDEEILYKRKEIVKNNVYYHHSTSVDNPFLPKQYLDTLDDLANYDYPLYQVARLGRFGATGTRVLPQLQIAKTSLEDVPYTLGERNIYFGFDFGFEESYNAVLTLGVDLPNRTLYILDEIYQNKITDDLFAQTEKMQALKKYIDRLNTEGHNRIIVADNEDPKAIQYYRQSGFAIRACRNKFAGSRLSNTRKIKRFKHIIVAEHCVNTIRELKDLTYKKDTKGNIIYDDFNIDPHTFSAIWYALDTVSVADVKERKTAFGFANAKTPQSNFTY